MKALYIILGVWVLITGICTIMRVTELDQVTAGIYVTCLGIMTVGEGVRAWRNK